MVSIHVLYPLNQLLWSDQCSSLKTHPPISLLPQLRTKLRLKLGLALQLWHHHVPNVTRSLIDIEGHTLAARVLGHDVELDTVLVDHIGNSPSVINDLAPTISIEELTRQLRRADEPGPAVSVRRVLKQLRCLFTILQHLLETKQMSVHALSIASVGDVLDMRIQRFPEQASTLVRRDRRVLHRAAESYRLIRDSPARLRAALLELARRGRLVCRAGLELLHQAFAVALVGFDLQLVLCDLADVVFSSLSQVLDVLLIELELQGLRVGDVRADLRVVKGWKLVCEDPG